MGAERLLRQARMTQELPFAVVQDRGQMQVISSLSQMAEERGLRLDQPLRDAMAMCPDLITRLRNPQSEARFLNSLRRWASKFSPWVAEEPPHSLVIDLTGCAHLFGGEEGVIEQVEQDCLDLGLSVHIGLADTKGAAWALARYAGQPLGVSRTGDAIDQEAPSHPVARCQTPQLGAWRRRAAAAQQSRRIGPYCPAWLDAPSPCAFACGRSAIGGACCYSAQQAWASAGGRFDGSAPRGPCTAVWQGDGLSDGSSLGRGPRAH